MTFEAVRSYLRTQGVTDENQIADLSYREGEWPGNLYIRLQDGREFRVAKFYYNYLIPFYITRTTLFSVDFANELTDISVGDAWNPKYEAAGQGFSVVVARTPHGQQILQQMKADGALVLDETSEEDALGMHGHMIDFKKRGAFIRMLWRRATGKPVPEYGYRPANIALTRYAVEAVISGVFRVCGLPPVRWLAEQIPLGVLGPAFNTARKTWKGLSKPTKRAGLGATQFIAGPQRRAGFDVPFTPVPEDAPLPDKVAAELRHWLRRDWSLADVGRHWDSTEHYDEINEETDSYFRRFTDGLRIAGPHLKDNAYTLDVTCRTGNGTLYFWQHGKVRQAVCVDPSPRMRAALQTHFAEADYPPEQYQWVQMTEERLPLPSETFETVLCFETLEHLADPQTFVDELARVTQTGGTALISTPNWWWEPVHALAAVTGFHHSEGPHRFLGRRALHQMVFQAGFDVLEEETTVLVPGGPGWLLALGRWIERRTRHTLMPRLGLRRILVCRKR